MDIFLASIAFVVLSPVLLCAAVAIRFSSTGPILFRARRVGKDGKLFTMYKFRTMRVTHTLSTSVITAAKDPRVFLVGTWLRKLKIDELPQLINILKGEMTFVGPRPEDPIIVGKYYGADGWETLGRLPGLSSPGSLYYYTHLEARLGTVDTEDQYGLRVLPAKLAVDRVYVRHASFLYDLGILVRTGWTIACMACGKREFREPPELLQARGLRHPEAGLEGTISRCSEGCIDLSSALGAGRKDAG
jgi:lipopolysaccharide/colanic/teichoic acid biosynthesis glycosyltransferase